MPAMSKVAAAWHDWIEDFSCWRENLSLANKLTLSIHNSSARQCMPDDFGMRSLQSERGNAARSRDSNWGEHAFSAITRAMDGASLSSVTVFRGESHVFQFCFVAQEP